MDEATNVIERPPEADETGGERQTQRPARRGWRLEYNPALDGIRGVAVGVVLLFHAGYPWARGGYLGVSTFFTLSGFLITSLLLGERSATGGISLGRSGRGGCGGCCPPRGHARGGGHRLAGVHRPADRGPAGRHRGLGAPGGQLAVPLRRSVLRRPVRHALAGPALLVAGDRGAVLLAVPPADRGRVRGRAGLGEDLRRGARRPAGGVRGDDGDARLQREHHRLLRHLHPHGRDPRRVAAGGGRVVRPDPPAASSAGSPRVAGVVALAAMGWCWWNLEQETPFISRGGLLAYSLAVGRARAGRVRARPGRAGRSPSSRCGCSASSRTASTSFTGRSSWSSTGSARAWTGSRSRSCASR